MEFSVLSLRLRALSALRGLLTHPLVKTCMDTLDALGLDADHFAECYGAFCVQHYACGDAAQAILDAIHYDTNTLTNTLDEPRPELLRAATVDIETLNELLALNGSALKETAAIFFREQALRCLPDFPAAAALPFSDGDGLVRFYREKGYGFFAQAVAFAVRDGGEVVPIRNTDKVRLSDLPGYERQKQQVLRNTRAFLHGREANNILLYGDKGTGKSSTIKAVVNEYASHGLKIIEMAPRHIAHFPRIFAETARAPFRFIVYLDDLCFNREDDNFAALKAFIEGGLAEKPANLIIYATSNRRHLVRESLADRQGDDVRVRDTLETVTSLSDRFGLEITFSVPDRDEYLFIVEYLANEAGIHMETKELHLLAERFALRRNGRSPRTARQFISQLLAEGESDT